MYNIDLKWHDFNVNLDAVAAYIVGLVGGNYLGASADYDLTLHFTQAPSPDQIEAIDGYWAALTPESTEATSYLPQSTIVSAISALRTGLVTKTWDQMSVAERKIVTGQTPTRADLGL